MNPRRLALAALAALALNPEARSAEPLPQGWELAVATAVPLTVTAGPVGITGGKLTGLALSGAWVLRGDHPNFGGFSGLLMSSGRLIAVSDKGWWLGASLRQHGSDLRLANTRLAPMRDGEGDPYTKAGGDAEGLALKGSRLVVSFERDHRLMVLRDTGRMGGTIQPRSFEQFRSNNGLEALATLPDGRLIAFSEGTDEGETPMFLIDPADGVTESRLPRTSNHSVTGADIGPDGRLYLVLRAYSVLFGFSTRVMRYQLGPDDLPLPGSAETLAAFEASSGIDNMEGIALDTGPSGEARLWCKRHVHKFVQGITDMITNNNFKSTLEYAARKPISRRGRFHIRRTPVKIFSIPALILQTDPKMPFGVDLMLGSPSSGMSIRIP
jgi:hypothetical protein